MILDFVLLDGPERTEADVQCDVADLHAHVRDLLQQFLRKVQARRRRSGAAELAGINRLIAFLVLQLRLDIRRQRHFAQPLEHLQKDAVIVKLHDLVAVGDRVDDRGGQLPVTKRERSAGLCLSARSGQALPLAVAKVAQQQHFDRTAGAAVAEQARREHARIVEHKAVVRAQELRQVIKVVVGNGAGRFIQRQQPGSIAALERCLRDELLRQVKIKIRFFHATYAPV